MDGSLISRCQKSAHEEVLTLVKNLFEYVMDLPIDDQWTVIANLEMQIKIWKKRSTCIVNSSSLSLSQAHSVLEVTDDEGNQPTPVSVSVEEIENKETDILSRCMLEIEDSPCEDDTPQEIPQSFQDSAQNIDPDSDNGEKIEPKRKRGRPRKEMKSVGVATSKEIKRSRGRPKLEYSRDEPYRDDQDGVQFNLDDITCKKCGKVFRDTKKLKLHEVKHTQKKCICETCGKSFSLKWILEKHMLSHDPSQHKCGRCYFFTKDEEELKVHKMEKHSKEKNESFICEECGKVFKKYSSLFNHKMTHREGEIYRRYKCKLCPFTTHRHSSLKNHVSGVHQSSSKFTCEICGVTTKRRAELRNHMRRHTGETPHKCDSCEKSFVTASQLAAHKRSHQDPTLECSECGKKFHFHNKLRRHQLIHSGEKEYECPYNCPYKCNIKSNLRKHCWAVHNMHYPPIVNKRVERS